MIKDNGKLKYLEEHLFKFHSVHHKLDTRGSVQSVD
jgi:hypothetical protein